MKLFLIALAFCSAALAQAADQCVCTPPSPEPQAGGDFTIGQTTVFTTDDSGNGNLILGQKTALSQAGIVKSLSFYVTTVGGALYLSIYSDKAGKPDALLVATAAFTPIAGWNTQPVTNQTVTLQPGTYWLTNQPASNALHFVKGSVQAGIQYHTQAFGPPPATFGTPTGSDAVQWSFYATLSPVTQVAVNGSPSAPTIGLTQFGSINFQWDAPALVAGAPTVTGYRLFVGLGSSGCPGSSTYATFSGTTGSYGHLPMGTTYTAQVSAMGSDGSQSACSNVATGQPK